MPGGTVSGAQVAGGDEYVEVGGTTTSATVSNGAQVGEAEADHSRGDPNEIAETSDKRAQRQTTGKMSSTSRGWIF
jgi:hypothetical protein